MNYTHRDFVQSFILRKDDYLILNTFQRISHWTEMSNLKKKKSYEILNRPSYPLGYKSLPKENKAHENRKLVQYNL